MIDFSLECERYVQALERDLESLVSQLRNMPEVHKVILFASYAKGRRDLFTELDLIVGMESEEDFVTRCGSGFAGLYLERVGENSRASVLPLRPRVRRGFV
jgi:hypothetical protein